MPRSEDALEVLQGWRAQFPASLDDHYVFPSELYGTWGTPGQKGFPATSQTAAYFTDPTKHVQTFATAWRTAKKTAGVECRWHDLRHSWVSRIAAAGAMDGTIQSMAGWMSAKMLATYSHPRNQAKRDAISAAFNRVPTESPQ